MTANKLSVILITKNEEHNIRACLTSVAFADEIIVVDFGSTDATVAIAREFTERVVTTEDWPGFGLQKNRALNLASHEWILSIDADERVTPALQKSIQNALNNPMVDGYYIHRISWYCGKWIYHGDWSRDEVLRLFKKTKARFSDDIVHEKIILNGKTDLLPHYLEHYSYRTMEEVLTKMNRYSQLSAEQRFAQNKKTNLLSAIGAFVWTFVRGYIIRRGFLDGQHGLLLAISNAQNSYYRHVKHWLLQQNL